MYVKIICFQNTRRGGSHSTVTDEEIENGTENSKEETGRNENTSGGEKRCELEIGEGSSNVDMKDSEGTQEEAAETEEEIPQMGTSNVDMKDVEGTQEEAAETEEEIPQMGSSNVDMKDAEGTQEETAKTEEEIPQSISANEW